jgi:maltose operon periplasmic protein
MALKRHSHLKVTLTKAFRVSALSFLIGGCAATLENSMSENSMANSSVPNSSMANSSMAKSTLPAMQPIAKPTCCAEYPDFFWLTLAKNDHLKVKLNHESPAWGFPEGKSYFSAFQFSASSGQVSVNIKSVMENHSVFAPKVILLDSHFEPKITYNIDQFQIRYANALDVNRYEINLAVNAQETPYMVIYSDSSMMGHKVIIPHPAKIRAIESGEPLPIVSDLTYLYAFGGELNISIETQSVRQHSATTRSANRVSSTESSAVHHAEDETVNFYHNAIKSAIRANNIEKALALLEEAKKLKIINAQRVFIEEINKKRTP